MQFICEMLEEFEVLRYLINYIACKLFDLSVLILPLLELWGRKCINLYRNELELGVEFKLERNLSRLYSKSTCYKKYMVKPSETFIVTIFEIFIHFF